MNKEIINNLKKAVYNTKIEVERGYVTDTREINLQYSIRNSLVSKERRENNFYYKDDKDKIEELIKKPQMEIFSFLAEKHLEKNQGFGKNPKQFQTPCYLCNQKTLTTLGWSEEGYPDNLERFFCRLCRVSSGWIDIKDDPIELQLEMRNYYLIFKEKELEKDEKRLEKIKKEQHEIEVRISKIRQFIEGSKEFIELNMNKFKNITNQELLAELRKRIIAGTIEVDWEDTYGDNSTITDLSTQEGKKWFYLNFDEALTENSKRKKLKK